jgi:hypothetical protein
VAQQGVLTNLDGLVWNKGRMYGTRSGGTTDAIEFGALQNVRVNHSFQKAEITGPESLSPLGVGIVSETLTGTFSFGVITPEQYYMALGGGLSYSGGDDETTYTKLVNEEPTVYNLRCVSELGASPGIEASFFRCVTDTWTILSGDNRAWMVGEGGFRVYGEENSGRLFTITKPGSLINQS